MTLRDSGKTGAAVVRPRYNFSGECGGRVEEQVGGCSSLATCARHSTTRHGCPRPGLARIIHKPCVSVCRSTDGGPSVRSEGKIYPGAHKAPFPPNSNVTAEARMLNCPAL